jgi:hypothetical protein
MKVEIIEEFFFGIMKRVRRIFVALFTLWAAMAVILIVNWTIKKAPHIEAANRIRSPAISQEEKEKMNRYALLSERLANPERLGQYKTDRDNIFGPWTGPPPVSGSGTIRVKRIGDIVLPYKYSGHIINADGSCTCQLTWRGRTLFPKAGEKIDGYGVISVTPEYVELQSPDNTVLRLEYKKDAVAFGAELYDAERKVSYNVRKGDEVGDFKVLDIAGDEVVISRQGKDEHLNPAGSTE